MVLDDDCTFPSFLQKYHHVVFGTTARLLVSTDGEKEGCAKVCSFKLSLSGLYPNVLCV